MLGWGIGPVRADQVLRAGVPEEIEAPGGGVADEVGREAAIEGGEVSGAFIFDDQPQRAQGGAEEGGAAAAARVDLESRFDYVERVDDGGGYKAGGQAGDGLYGG